MEHDETPAEKTRPPIRERIWMLIIRRMIPLAIFGVLFLPGAIKGAELSDQPIDFLNSGYFIGVQTISNFFMIVGLLLLILFLERDSESAADLKHFNPTGLLWTFAYIPAAVALSMAMMTLASLLDPELLNQEITPLNRLELLPYLFLMMISTGYMEEIFFRGYLIDSMKGWMPASAAVGIATLLFAIGHGYQGLAAIPGTFALGLLFYDLRRRTRSLHIPAITHGLYNFTAILMGLLERPPVE